MDDTECVMATSKRSALGGRRTSQLRIVLLGGRNSGKSSVGNLLLGNEEFVTRERTSCSRRACGAAGRWLAVVDTPGWWCDFSARDTSELVRRGIVCGVSLCSPGPHAFLIAVKASSAFPEARRRAVEEHVALLGEGAWAHCVLVLTCADGRERAEAGERVRTGGGGALRWLWERCGRRCRCVALSDGAGAAELLREIRTLVTENGDGVFEMRGEALRAAVEEQRRAEERARRRFMRMRKHRCLLQERLQPVTDIRIVLLGAKGSGKTSAMNTILGRHSNRPLSRTAQCTVGSGVVFERQVTAVDTPGWWMNYLCDETTAFDRREMLLGLSLCPPGPHVFLLVIRADRAFTETHGRAAREHLGLIGEHVWSRVLVLFCSGDWLGGTTTEQYIESEGEPLRWLVDRCGNRYHVLNNKTRGDGFQVRELIGKIEEMLAEDGNYQYFEIERDVTQQLEAKMRREKERAKERLMRKERQRQMAKSQLGKLNPLPEVCLVLVGGRKTGKSSCGNTILSRECFDVGAQTTSCAEKRGEIGGKTVRVLDTPGRFSVTPDLLAAPRPCALLLVVNVSSSFTDAQREGLEEQLEAGGGQVWGRAMVLFSHGDWLGDTSVERRIESEGESLRRLVEKCGNRYHILDNKNPGDGAQVRELVELVEEMLGGERLAALHRGDPVWKCVSAAQDEEPGAVTLCREGFKVSRDSTKSATSTAQTSLNCWGGTDASGQMVAALVERARRRAGPTTLDIDGIIPVLTSVLSDKSGLSWTSAGQQSLTLNLPIWFPAEGPHSRPRPNGESQVLPFSPVRPAVLLALPHTQSWVSTEENVISVHSLRHPALRDRTLRRLAESGGLQQLIDQWGDSSLEELEAFIDAYFEMVWEQTMGSFRPTEADSPATERDAVAGEAGEEEEEKEEEKEEVLSSIDRKLSKLELLEEIRSEMVELRKSLEQSWKAIQELIDKRQQDPSNTC